ncbi:MAG: DUF1576 domain-containing protein [Oscillospiraceae bacterium]|nr:DUF1576 domain-containing protein [Oscillospiraceae bacterium]
MENKIRLRRRFYLPYVVLFSINFGFFLCAFFLEKPSELLDGLLKIVTSSSILVTDYIAVGGVGSALLNVSLVGFVSILILMLSGVKPNGATIMALWLTAGFSFFGKNLFNMLPLTIGVWLFSKYKREPFVNYSLAALLVATLTPVVSEIGFLGTFPRIIEISVGILFGFVIGFIFPSISAHTVRIHGGYNLYNMGFAGGLIAVIFSTVLRSFRISIEPADIWSSGNNLVLAVILYSVSVILVCVGFFAGGFKKSISGFRKILTHSGRLVTDYYFLYENSVFINMGVLCAFATTVVLLMGAQLNGVAIAGIFTMTGFACFGKHLRNVVPVIAGAIISAYLNEWEFTSPSKVAAILFSAALAPISGHYGWIWGAVAGFLHVNVAMFVSEMNSGLNLYNNGFAAGFVAMFMLPLLSTFKKDKDKLES